MELWRIIGSILLFLVFLQVVLSAVAIFFEGRQAQSAWAWLLALVLFPIPGLFFYLLFGRDGRKAKIFAQKSKEDARAYYALLFVDGGYQTLAQHAPSHEYSRLEHLNLRSGALPTTAAEVSLFTEGSDKFHSLLTDIAAAKATIDMEYYIIRDDPVGRAFVAALTERAKAGVRVRLLYDGMGCHNLPRRFFDPLKNAGGEVAAFLPPLFIRINYRNHRKIGVIDDIIGYIGGFNIGEEYLGATKRYGHWRDTHLRLTGAGVGQLSLRFAMDWHFTAGTPWQVPPLEQKAAAKPEPTHLQVVSSGPDAKWQTVKNGYFTLINAAKDHIYLATPYFVPDEAVFTALEVAALSGVDVRIMIPKNPDHAFVYWASISYLAKLLPSGVKAYAYSNGFLHSKALSVDGKVCSLGTANMDIRSFYLNFETNAVLFDENLARAWEAVFLADIKESFFVTQEWYDAQGGLFHTKEAFSRLLSPII